MRYKEEKGVISIIAVLSIGIFALGTSLVLAQGVLQQMTINRSNVSTYQAFYTAESGAGEGIYNFKNDLSYRDRNDTLSGINGLSANISADHIVNGYANIISESTNGDNHRNVKVTLRNFPDDEGFAFDYGLYTPQVIDFHGNVTINGPVFATNGTEGEESGSVDVNGPIIKNQTADIPIIDDVSYIAESQPDTYFTNVVQAQEYIKDNPGINKVIFVDNTNLMKVQNINLNGTLWTNGNLKLSSGGIITAGANHIALFVGGDLEITGGVTINGIVYVLGETTIGAGNVVINGSLISMGGAGIDVGGTFTVNYQPSILDFWQDLVGLQNDSSYDLDFQPEFSSWNEQ
jgi:hypothetical protein